MSAEDIVAMELVLPRFMMLVFICFIFYCIVGLQDFLLRKQPLNGQH